MTALFPRPGRRLVLGAATLAVLIAATGCSGTEDPAQKPASALALGVCLSASPANHDQVWEVPAIDCASEHSEEVYDVFTASGHETSEIEEEAQERCAASFTAFIGQSIDDSELNYYYLSPTEDSLAAGDQQVSCIVQSASPVTGTLKNSKR